MSSPPAPLQALQDLLLLFDAELEEGSIVFLYSSAPLFNELENNEQQALCSLERGWG